METKVQRMNPNPALNQAHLLEKPWTWSMVRAEPYRLLFPLGTASAVIGIGIWIPYYFWPTAFPYPGQGHAMIQIQAFMLCFIFGFLTTMLPKILGIKPLGPLSFAAFPILIIGSIIASLASAPILAQSLHLALLLVFLGYMIRQYPQRRSNGPPDFLFIAVAILVEVLGTAAKVAALSGSLPPLLTGPALTSGSILQYQAFPLLLILGVGGFLLPKLFGNAVPTAQNKRSLASPGLKSTMALCLMFLASYGIEITGIFMGLGTISLQAAYGLRTLVWAWFVFQELRVHQVPGKLQPYLRAARISLYVMAVGLALPVFRPGYMLAWEHVIFLSGFMRLTLSIASRVMAAHAGRMDILALNARQVRVYGILIVLSMMTRIATEIWPKGHNMHLAIASVLALAALYMWGKINMPLLKIFP